ncbi:MAG: hypothetical protein CM15mP51_06370 [Porticoccaceae bacterium]|nr:MAG: hypothetical protein CM15mP51_06370 [Porticoccaceae bacterium]
MDEKPVCSFCTRARILIICTIVAGIVAFRPEFDFIKNYDLLKFSHGSLAFPLRLSFCGKLIKVLEETVAC